MKRYPDWRSRLRTYLDAKATEPFRPGKHDCAMFVMGAVEAMTGEDPAHDLRGKYRTLEDARGLVRQKGVADMIGLAEHRLGDEVPAIFAGEGDVAVLTDDEGLPAFGLVQGALVYVLRPSGLGLVPLTQAERAFRV